MKSATGLVIRLGKGRRTDCEKEVIRLGKGWVEKKYEICTRLAEREVLNWMFCCLLFFGSIVLTACQGRQMQQAGIKPASTT